MLRSPLLLVFTPLLAVAAPVPKQTEKEKIEAAFGKMVDPKGDSKFALDGDALKVTLPAEVVRGFGATFTDVKRPNGKWGKDVTYHNDVPRVEFERAGDFVLTVRVRTPLAGEAKQVTGVKGGNGPHLAGGVLVIQKDGSWTRLIAARERSDDGIRTTFLHDDAGLSAARNLLLGFQANRQEPWGETTWLRVTRKGKRMRAELSEEGKTWDDFGKGDGVFPANTATLALYAQHGSDKSHTVTFDQFSVEKPKAEKK